MGVRPASSGAMHPAALVTRNAHGLAALVLSLLWSSLAGAWVLEHFICSVASASLAPASATKFSKDHVHNRRRGV